jgi:hypothetical protein
MTGRLRTLPDPDHLPALDPRFTIPNQSSVAMPYKEFDAAGRMRP